MHKDEMRHTGADVLLHGKSDVILVIAAHLKEPGFERLSSCIIGSRITEM